MEEPCVSVVIPTYNRPDVLKRVLASYLEQPQCAEIIVVDDGSSARFERYWPDVKTAGEPYGIPVAVERHGTRRGASAARNTGIRRARCPFIMTTDDDIRLEGGYMADCLRVLHEADRVGYVGGRVVYLRNRESDDEAHHRALADRQSYLDLGTLTVCFWGHCDGPTRVPFCSGVGIWDRRVFDQGVCYDEGYLGNAYREESDPQIAAQAKGFFIVYQPDAFAYHLPPEEINARTGGQHRGSVLWYEYWAMRNNLRFLRKYGDFLKREWNVRPLGAAANFELRRIRHGATKIFGRFLRAG